MHHLARNLPPTVIHHGRKDPLMPYELVEEFCTKARTLGNQCELVGIDDAAHDVARARQAETDAGLVAFLKPGLSPVRAPRYSCLEPRSRFVILRVRFKA